MSLDAPLATSSDASGYAVGIVAARYNERLVDALLAQVADRLKTAGVKARNITIARVPGSNELPVAVQLLMKRKRVHVVVALGVLIRGDTIHYELIAEATAHGLQQAALEARTPVINGVVVAENQAQAEARCRGGVNRGAEFAAAALEMAALKKRFS